ncbi:MAG: UMP kinase [Kiritimatiellia bacterium]
MKPELPSGTKYKRVLLKLSGEVLRDRRKDVCIAPAALARVAAEVKAVHALGVEVAMVVGGGNIIRGVNAVQQGLERVLADQMGMLATVINALALQSCFERQGLVTRVQSAIEMPKVTESFILPRAVRHLEKGRVVIFAGGTGNPYFSTDTAAALRASEIKADVLLKATKVDGVYSADPAKDRNAVLYRKIRYQEALRKSLNVMDPAAFALCLENHIPIIVFNFYRKNGFERAVKGEEIGTLLCN